MAIAFQLCLQYAIWRVHVNQDDLKLNAAHRFLVYSDDVNKLGRTVHTTSINKNTEA